MLLMIALRNKPLGSIHTVRLGLWACLGPCSAKHDKSSPLRWSIEKNVTSTACRVIELTPDTSHLRLKHVCEAILAGSSDVALVLLGAEPIVRELETLNTDLKSRRVRLADGWKLTVSTQHKICFAVRHGHPQLVQGILQGTVIADMCMEEDNNVGPLRQPSESLLRLLCKLNHVEVARLLIEAGADIHGRLSYADSNMPGATPFATALQYRAHQTVDMLIEQYPTVVDCPYNLDAVLELGGEPVVRAILNAGADLNQEDHCAFQIIFNSVCPRRPDRAPIARILIQHGAAWPEPSSPFQYTAFLDVLASDNTAVMQVLLECTTLLGHSMLGSARSHAMACLLLRYGYDVNQGVPNPLLQHARLEGDMARGHGLADVLELLLPLHQNINMTDEKGNTALSLLCGAHPPLGGRYHSRSPPLPSHRERCWAPRRI